MTVAELIEKLKEMPGDLPVGHIDEMETWEVERVELDNNRLFSKPGENSTVREFVLLV